MIRTIEHAKQVQSRREAAGLRGCAGAVKRFNRTQGKGRGVPYKAGRPSKARAGGAT